MSFFSKLNRGVHSLWHGVTGDGPTPSYFTGAYHHGARASAPAPASQGSVVVPPATASEVFHGYTDAEPARPPGVGRPPDHPFTEEELRDILE
jgi:hypothetical protein